ncbi:MAG: universal stress protein [Alphaproteobacteria bacterium]|nr:universal stress protein [Alphaproteobacteria bacterium SS10]
MPIKNILLHMANDDRHSERLDLAVSLARRHNAHLHICYFTLPQSMPAAVTGRGASYAYIAEATAIAREKAEALRHEVETKCTKLDWSLETLEEDHVDAMARRTYLADLAIVSQSNNAAHSDRITLHLPDELSLATACGVLVLPHDPSVQFEDKHIIVAWKPTRESSRGLRDSIGLMRDAERVTVVSLFAPDDRVVAEDETGQVVSFLKNHGIEAQPHLVEPKRGQPYGEMLLQTAAELSADGIVMGAYSHSRFRERVLGGMTRYMLQHTTIPLIMSH